MTTFKEYIKEYVQELIKLENIEIDDVDHYLECCGHLDEKYMRLYEEFYC